MATIENTRGANLTQPFGGFTNMFWSAMTGVSKWNDTRATRKALESLSERELTDIGLSRGEIEAVAKRRAF